MTVLEIYALIKVWIQNALDQEAKQEYVSAFMVFGGNPGK